MRASRISPRSSGSKPKTAEPSQPSNRSTRPRAEPQPFASSISTQDTASAGKSLIRWSNDYGAQRFSGSEVLYSTIAQEPVTAGPWNAREGVCKGRLLGHFLRQNIVAGFLGRFIALRISMTTGLQPGRCLHAEAGKQRSLLFRGFSAFFHGFCRSG